MPGPSILGLNIGWCIRDKKCQKRQSEERNFVWLKTIPGKGEIFKIFQPVSCSSHRVCAFGSLERIGSKI